MVNTKYALFTILLLLIGPVFAADVAYIYSSSSRIDSNVVNIFNSLDLSIEYISISQLPTDLSEYKFVFIGDEYFSKDIPIESYNTIIANHYLGKDSGITDGFGISSMTSTEAPKVTFKGDNVQVYDYSKDSSGIYIPYYFLSDLHKSSSTIPYAGTYSTSSGNFGDVVSFIDSGSELANGKTAKGNICFFGIIKSAHWTPGAEDLFRDCVGFVNVAENQTPKITCSLDTNCGNSTSGNNFCSNNSVVKNLVTFKCNNPATPESYCSNKTELVIVSNCNNFCSAGSCQNFVCISNLSCNDNNSSTEDICINPSSPTSSCKHNIYPTIACRADLDCNDHNSSTEDICTNPSTINSVCSHKAYHITCNSNLDCNDKNSSTSDVCINLGSPNSSCVYYVSSKTVYLKLNFLTASPLKTSVVLNFSVDLGNSSGISGYYLSKGNDSWDFISGGSSGYVFEGLTPATNYTFFIIAVDNNNFSSKANISTRTLEESSGNSGGGSSSGDSSTHSGRGISGLCITKWSCTDWSSCKDGNQVRNCYYPPEFCAPEEAKPVESKDCIEAVVTDITNDTIVPDSQNDTIKQGFSITGSAIGSLSKYPWLWIIIFLVVIGLLYLYVRKRRASKKKK